MHKCYWCAHDFENGEVMHLASFKEVLVGNRVLCESCAKNVTDQSAATLSEPISKENSSE